MGRGQTDRYIFIYIYIDKLKLRLYERIGLRADYLKILLVFTTKTREGGVGGSCQLITFMLFFNANVQTIYILGTLGEK